MMNFKTDWVLLKAALGDLRDYILSPELYWTLRPPDRTVDGTQLPQLTIGNLLLSQARLAAGQLDAQESEELQAAARQIHALREEWKTNWGLKAAKEFSSRLARWQKYLQELRGDRRGSGSFYPSEVRNRAILRLLSAEMVQGISPQDEEQVAAADGLLKVVTNEGPFVWEPEVQPSFPPDGFWFLYRSAD